MDQISFFDLDPEFKLNSKPETIKKLDEEIKELFKGNKIRESKYEVWSHVPQYGKRYCVYIDNVDPEKVEHEKIDDVTERYAEKKLDVSFNMYQDIVNKGKATIIVSTYWKTKGYKEVWSDG